jgi:hypothetical protein
MDKTKGLEKLNYDPIPAELGEEIIKFALEVHEKNIGLAALANIVPPNIPAPDTAHKMDISDNNVYIYLLYPKLVNKIQKCYSKFFENHPTLSVHPGRGVIVQIINGPINGQQFNTIQPHSDPNTRPESLMYILSTGGNNVKTTWYKIKDDQIIDAEQANKETNIYDYPVYSKDMLEPIEEHIMEEDCWYHFNHTIPHGVDNIESVRIIVSCFLEYETVMKNVKVQPDLNQLSNDWASLDSLR